ncbi:DUF6702 family protein [Flavobacterium terrae]|uniref:Peptidase E n=1 Tax=Flavobacterium terrae TaxID=415425 RepID=A0A1M6DS83_9FLAO|nr:DUF6702 family protein [Flavobacterium terrae]SHI76035.1 hypothetical protein SAMN05444363_1604 [Flavobacterium terrae]
MKKILRILFLMMFFASIMSFAAHKFYVAIYQVNYAQDKKMIQITSRIFVDDLNSILKEKYKKRTLLGEASESVDDVALMKKYLAENFVLKVNGQTKVVNFLSKEMEGNVLICYYNVKDVSKIKTLEIQNTVLLDFTNEQQNIVHTKIYEKKQSFLFTSENVKGMLKV